MAPSDRFVSIVEDDSSLREALAGLLRSHGHKVRAFACAEEYLAVRDGLCGCVISDIRMPGLSGLDLQLDLAAAGEHIPVIFVTGYADVPLAVRAMKAGAQEVLTKPYDQQLLLDAVHRALQTATARHEEREQLIRLRAAFETLTPREREVLVLVASGLVNRHIAARLGTSEKTIKVHRANVMRKMGADSVAALVRMVDRLAIAT